MDCSSLKSSVNKQSIAADKWETLWGMSAKCHKHHNARSCCGSSLRSSVNKHHTAADNGVAPYGKCQLNTISITTREAAAACVSMIQDRAAAGQAIMPALILIGLYYYSAYS